MGCLQAATTKAAAGTKAPAKKGGLFSKLPGKKKAAAQKAEAELAAEADAAPPADVPTEDPAAINHDDPTALKTELGAAEAVAIQATAA